jgi:hypothetical protein
MVPGEDYFLGLFVVISNGYPTRSIVWGGRYPRIRCPHFKGTVVYPEEFKYPEIEIQLVEGFAFIPKESVTPSIGSMSANGRLLSVYVSVPVERIKTLVSVAPHVLVVDFHASPLHYRRALVVSIQLDTEVE